MPELPEVESVRRGLVPHLIGNTVTAVEVRKPKLVSGRGTVRKSDTAAARLFEKTLKGQTIRQITRRAKMLAIEFESGIILAVHLKMSGQLVFQVGDETPIWGGHPIPETHVSLPHKHTHVIFSLSNGTLYYNDQRMFGYLLVYPSRADWELDVESQALGREPFGNDFTREYFTTALISHTQTLKSIFLSQSVVSGLGNIYADEVCFAAGILPTRLGQNLTKAECSRLYDTMLRILTRAIELGGSSIANYLLVDGSPGDYAKEHMVYGRSGLPCLDCGKKLQKTVVATRTTVYCPQCQV